MPMPPTPESEAIDTLRLELMTKMDAIITLLGTYVADVAAAEAEAEAEAEAAAALVVTSAHTNRTATATEALAHRPSGTANPRAEYRQDVRGQ